MKRFRKTQAWPGKTKTILNYERGLAAFISASIVLEIIARRAFEEGAQFARSGRVA
jgi:hypothetical protein